MIILLLIRLIRITCSFVASHKILSIEQERNFSRIVIPTTRVSTLLHNAVTVRTRKSRAHKFLRTREFPKCVKSHVAREGFREFLFACCTTPRRRMGLYSIFYPRRTRVHILPIDLPSASSKNYVGSSVVGRLIETLNSQ